MFEHAVDLQSVDPRVLMADSFIAAKRLVYELVAVDRSGEFDRVTHVGQEFRCCRSHVDGTLTFEGIKSSHARRVVHEQDQVHDPPKRGDIRGTGKVNVNALQRLD